MVNLHPYFKLRGIEPGRVISVRFGEIDFRQPMSIERLKELYEGGVPYLQLTAEGKKALYPTKPRKPNENNERESTEVGG